MAHQPWKLEAGSWRPEVESNLPPPTSHLQDRGAVAQLGERRLCKAEVGGSSPPGSTNEGARPEGRDREISASLPTNK